MTPRVSCTALITADVFQNSLTRKNPRWRYYTNLLQRSSSAPVRWFMTWIDYQLAQISLSVCEEDVEDSCEQIYRRMLKRVQPCSVDDWEWIQQIWQERDDCKVNALNSRRMACVIEYAIDVIVTCEPHRFTRNVEDHYRIQANGYFFIPIPAESAEPDDDSEQRIGVFSVDAFLLHFDEIINHREPKPRQLQGFRLEQFYFSCGEYSEATVIILDPRDGRSKTTARGNSPIDAIQKAVDQTVDQYVQMPLRRLSRFLVAPATLLGADSPIEVVVGIECGDLSLEESACSSNTLRAAADAYVKVINSICAYLKLNP